MPCAYLVIQVDVHDPESFDAYRIEGPAILARYGGEYTVRGGDYEVLEGDAPLARQVVIRFPDRKAALAWYESEAYAALKAIRQAAATTRMLLVNGVD